MTDLTDLKPCPFCGSRNLNYYINQYLGGCITCVDCKLMMCENGCRLTLEELIERWNRRVGE